MHAVGSGNGTGGAEAAASAMGNVEPRVGGAVETDAQALSARTTALSASDFYAQGKTFVQSNEFENAIQAFEQALALGDFRAAYQFGCLYSDLCGNTTKYLDFNHAIYYYAQAIANLDPESSQYKKVNIDIKNCYKEALRKDKKDDLTSLAMATRHLRSIFSKLPPEAQQAILAVVEKSGTYIPYKLFLKDALQEPAQIFDTGDSPCKISLLIKDILHPDEHLLYSQSEQHRLLLKVCKANPAKGKKYIDLRISAQGAYDFACYLNALPDETPLALHFFKSVIEHKGASDLLKLQARFKRQYAVFHDAFRSIDGARPNAKALFEALMHRHNTVFQAILLELDEKIAEGHDEFIPLKAKIDQKWTINYVGFES